MPHAVGSQTVSIHDATTPVDFPALVFYPSPTPSTLVALGPSTIPLAPDAPIADGRFPLVVISHGAGGSHLAYWSLASALTRAGFLVVIPEHPGNNRRDNTLDGTVANLTNRPRHLRRTIDTVMAHAVFTDHVVPETVVLIGHSMGGYTSLAVAGGQPCTEQGVPVNVQPDARVKALVLLAPATPWYMQGDSLQAVQVPILLLTAEHDPYTPAWHAQLILDRLPVQTAVTHRVIANAGHFSFLSPFPAHMQQPDFLPAHDPAGFDRAAFQAELAAEIDAFVQHTLAPTVGHTPAVVLPA